MPDKPAITISRLDLDRIESLLQQAADTDAHAALRDELQRADVVEPRALPDGVVSMNSTARLVDVDNGEEMQLTLVYPRDAGAGKVSVLAPVGSALLGLAVDQQIEWPLPGGRTRRLRVLEVSYQPEAAGDYHR